MFEDIIAHASLTMAYFLIFVIIFAESGLFFGFFLPGDSLLFGLGLLAAQGHLNIWLLLVIGCLAAILGDTVGYWFGRKVGPALFNRDNSLLFKRENVIRAQVFYEQHGKKTIVLARFMPIVRTFAPIVAGVGKMHYPTFLLFNILGGTFWMLSVTLCGYFLGKVLPAEALHKYTLLIYLLIILISLAPVIKHLRKK